MPPTLHLVRHGEGEHNVEPTIENRQIRDPSLTQAAVTRCQGFNNTFPDYVHIDLVCASPLRRTIQTAKYCFADRIPKTTSERILLIPLNQEVTDQPCDTGSSATMIEKEFGDLVDTSMLESDWNGKEGIYAATTDGLAARSKALRKWLYDRPEKDIVIVGHGAFFDFMLGANAYDVLKPGISIHLFDVNVPLLTMA